MRSSLSGFISSDIGENTYVLIKVSLKVIFIFSDIGETT